MKNLFISILSVGCLSFIISLSSCHTKGCTDSKAINQKFDADENDGSCKYSKAIFYGSQISPFPPVTVNVNGSSIGTINAFYPSGPGNCSVPGVATYQFVNGSKIDWVAIDAVGTIFSGTLDPSSVSECLKVRVF